MTFHLHRKIRKRDSCHGFLIDPPGKSFSPTPDILLLWSSCFPIGVTPCKDSLLRWPVSLQLTHSPLLNSLDLTVHCSKLMCYIIVIITNIVCCCFYFIINFSVYSIDQFTECLGFQPPTVSSLINMISRFIFSSRAERTWNRIPISHTAVTYNSLKFVTNSVFFQNNMLVETVSELNHGATCVSL